MCLDGSEVTRTERFKAQQNFEANRREVIQLQVNNVSNVFMYKQDVTGWDKAKGKYLIELLVTT